MAVATMGTAAHMPRSWFGDVALLIFLLTQISDGILTYVGVHLYGLQIEANPLVAWLMSTMGHGPALAAAKTAAALFGIALHLSAVHGVVAALALFYMIVAVLPWLAILLYGGQFIW